MADGILWQLVGGVGKDWVPQFQQGYDRGEQQVIKNNRRSVLEQLTVGPDGNVDAKTGLTQLIKAGDLQGAAQFAQTAKMLQPETTDEIKEYNLFRQQGGTLPFTEWKIKIKTASAPKINNVINNSENAYATTLAKNDAERFIELNKSGAAANARLNTLQALENLSKTPDFYSGFGGDTRMKVNKALTSLGIANPNAASSAEAFNALTNQLTLDATGGKLGAGVSNADVAFLQSINPNLSTTPEGNAQIIGIQRKIAQRQAEVSQLARQYAQRNGGRLDAGFDEQLARWAEKNPLFPQAQQSPPQTAPSLGDIEAEMRRRNMLK